MIYLSASSDLVKEKNRQRKRDFELEIDTDYYGLVNAAYEEYFAAYTGKRLRIPMDEWNFVNDPHLFERLASLVDGELDNR